MKLIKMVGLAAVAAIAAMAFMGASSASASITALCATHTEPCPSPLPAGTHIQALLLPGKHATLLTSAGNVLCEGSHILGSTTTGLGTSKQPSVLGNITEVTFLNCKLGTTDCTVTSEASTKTPFLSHLLKTALNLGTMTVLNPSAHVECGSFIDCTYGFGAIDLHVHGGNPAEVLAVEEKLTREEGFFCSGESFWDAEYEVTLPKPLYITS